jgi:hypothetical protein
VRRRAHIEAVSHGNARHIRDAADTLIGRNAVIYIGVRDTVFLPQLKGDAGGDVRGVLLQALPHVRSYAVDKGVLILKGPDGKVLVSSQTKGLSGKKVFSKQCRGINGRNSMRPDRP